MKKEDIEKKYNELVNSIEKKRMYDGRELLIDTLAIRAVISCTQRIETKV